jgi:putative phosphoribosyl transferase
MQFLDRYELNRHAAAQWRCPDDLVVVDGAGHLFEEPGVLQRVAEPAVEWFQSYLVSEPDEALSEAG